MNRAILIGPVALTLVGAAVGVCLAMLYYQEPNERAHVYLDDSLPLFQCGAVAGWLTGCGVWGACVRWPRIAPMVGVVVVVLLGAASAAPLGWIVGDCGNQRLSSEGMVGGAVVGAGLGLLIGTIQWHLDQQKPNAEPNPTAVPEGVDPSVKYLQTQMSKLSEAQKAEIRRLARSGRIEEAIQAAEVVLGTSLGDAAVFAKELYK